MIDFEAGNPPSAEATFGVFEPALSLSPVKALTRRERGSLDCIAEFGEG